MDSLINKTLGQYQIIEEIGWGGMAVVYKAYQPALERYVAIKVLPHQFTFDQEFVERFLREARAAAKLNHPHIVTIHDVGQADGTYFIVMEYLEGPSLADLLRQQGALPPQQVAQIVAQVASALDYAHGQGFVHRDVKPSNILMGAEKTPKLADFGIVRAAEGTRLTQTGTVLGTPEYMSPEQAKGLGIDRRTDIYSLGIVVYEMLAGQVPFGGDTMAVLHAHAYEAPDLSVLPAGIGAVVGKALMKEPVQRYGSAGTFAQMLATTVGIPIAEVAIEPPTRVVASPGIVRPSARARRRTPAWIFGMAGVLVVLSSIIGLVARNIGSDEFTPTPPREEIAIVVVSETAEEPVGPPTASLPSPTKVPTAVPSPTQLPGPTDSLAPGCPGAPTQQVRVGDRAWVCTAYEQLIMREQPRGSSSEIARLKPRTYVAIVDGPVCEGGWSWWKVRTDSGVMGWVAEGGDAVDPYFICPSATDVLAPSPTPCGVAVHSGFASVWRAVQDRLGCPTRGVRTNQWIAEETFEHGRMFWRQDNDHHYVLYANGTWERFPNTWSEEMPVFTCGIPESPPTPLRGFGKVWCDRSWVREGLGNATVGEWGEYSTVQDFVNGGSIIRSGSGTYILYADGKWGRR
jgi:serine/threonine protein kinase